MNSNARDSGWQAALIALAGAVISVLVVATLYYGRKVLIPVAMALLLTFILSPLVAMLRRRGLGRIPSTALVMAVPLIVLVGVSWLVTQQTTALVKELSENTGKITARIESVRESGRDLAGGEFGHMVDEILSHIQPRPADNKLDMPNHPEAKTVVVQNVSQPWFTWLLGVFGHLTEFLAQFAFAVVLFIFMLIGREDLRNRLVRLAGLQQMTVTLRALDDAAQRLGSYLRMQLLINAAYGATLTLGLFVIGVPNSVLWGIFAFLLRFVPYVGALLAALFPLLLSAALADSWIQPILTLTLIVALEVITANLVEPYLFGQSMGVTAIAQLTAAAAFAFLWGPVGMILSGPIIVCLLVLGKYVPCLRFLEVLLGDEPPLTPVAHLYQRLAAQDQDEAADILRKSLADASVDGVCEGLLLPVLSRARLDCLRKRITREDERQIVAGVRGIVEETREAQTGAAASSEDVPTERQRIFLCPARDDREAAALEILGTLLDPLQWQVQRFNTRALEKRGDEKSDPPLLCIGLLAPGGLAEAVSLCKRMRCRFPQARIVVGLWRRRRNSSRARRRLRAAGANQVVLGFLRTRAQLEEYLAAQALTRSDRKVMQTTR